MEQPHAPLGESLALQALGHLGGRTEIGVLRLLHERVDDIHLPPFPDLSAEKIVDLAALRSGAGKGGDGPAPGRQFVEDGDVEIAIEGEGEGARDGGGRHHEHVGALALAAKRRAMGHPEAVLLVDHGQSQALEGDRALDEGVGADDTAGLAALHRRGGFQPRLALDRAREEHRAHAERLEEPADGHEVLLGEDLGRSHDRRLIAGLDGGEGGEGRHHRLARSHIALEEPAHRVRLGHVGADLAPHALLGRGERIG